MITLENKNKELFQTAVNEIFQKTQDGILIVDKNGAAIFCNDPLLNYFGLASENFIGRNVRKTIHEMQIFDVMRSGKDSVNSLGFLQSKTKSDYENGGNLHLLSRYALSNAAGNILGGILWVHFGRTIKERAAKLYGVDGLASLFQKESLTSAAQEGPTAIGVSESFQKARQLALRAGKNDFSVLITGETGVGKEVIADLIRSASARSKEPFIKINCAAIPADLLESELFGYSPGAFTGASREGKKGKFELAQHGTIFLDEIGDMPLYTQVKLLRVLQEKKVEPVGGSRPVPIDIRVISATSRNLEEMIQNGTFREDLYYRLNVIHIHVPPLRERKEDILPLTQYFLSTLNKTYSLHIGLPAYAKEALLAYPWPGNIRELNNVIQSAYALTDGDRLELHPFLEKVRQRKEKQLPQISSVGESRTLEEIMSAYEKQVITETLKDCQLNISLTAKRLGVPRSSIYNKIKRYQIDLLLLRFEARS